MNQKVIVTGGAGFIGSHTVVELLQKDFEVVIFDNLSNSNEKVMDGIEKITGRRPTFQFCDVSDPSVIEFFNQHSDAVAIIHFAALKAVGESVDQPLRYYKNNMVGLVNVLDGMCQNDIGNFIFSSSATVYGQPELLPATESSPIQPAISPYGNTKQIGEEVLKDVTVGSEFDLNVISLRYFNPIGAHPTALIGELPIGVPNNLMPFITQSAAGVRGPLKVFGSDYNTPDGTAIRDYIHVVDLAEAHIVALERLLEKKNKAPFEVFNLGTGRGNSVLEVIRSFERSTGVKLEYELVDRRPGDAEQVYAATDLALKELNWQTKLELDDMTRTAWEWQKRLG